MTAPRYSVLFVSPRPDTEEEYRKRLREPPEMEIEWVRADPGGITEACYREKPCDLVLAEAGPDVGGAVDLVHAVRRAAPDCPLVLVLDENQAATDSLRLIRAGAQEVLIQGTFDAVALKRTILHTIERKRAETVRRESEERYRALFENHPQPMMVYDLETLGILAVNQSAISLYGHTRDEFLAMTIRDLHPEEDIPALEENVAAVKEGLDQAGLWRHRLKDGRVIHVDITSHTTVFAHRRAELVMAVDVTARVEMEEENRRRKRELEEALDRLAANESLMRIAGEKALLGGWYVDLRADLCTWTGITAAIHGEPDGFSPTIEEGISYYAPEYREIIARHFSACAESGVPFDLDLQIINRAGRRVWVRSIGEPVRDAAGRIIAVQGAFQDISAAKAVEEETRELASRFFTTLESITDAFYLIDKEWNFAYLNAEAERLLNRKRSELLNKNIWKMFPEAVQTGLYTHYHEAADEGVTREFDLYYPPLEIWFNIRIYPSREGLAVYFRDITASRVESSLRLAESRILEKILLREPLKEVLGAIAETVDEVSSNGIASILLYDPVGPKLRLGAAPGLPAAYNEALDGVLIGPETGSCGTAAHSRQPVLAADIATDPLWENYKDLALAHNLRSCWSYPVLSGDGRVLATFALYYQTPREPDEKDRVLIERVLHLVSLAIEHYRQQEALLESEERFRKLLNEVPSVAVQGYGPDGGVTYWNAASERLYGYSAAEAMGKNLLELIIPPELRDPVAQAMEGMRRGGPPPAHGELLLRRKDGSRVPVYSSHVVVKSGSGPPEMFCLDVDLTDFKNASRRVDEQAALLDKAQDAILVRDLDHIILYWNKSAERIYGWTAEEAVGKSIRELLYRDDKDFLAATAETVEKGEWKGEIRQFTRAGEALAMRGSWSLVRDDQDRPKSILAINTDITELKRIERQFLRAQRMESIGTLAGGIAHDLNNVLSPIMMSVDLLKIQAESAEFLSTIEMIGNSAKRGAQLVSQVLSFARGVDGDRRQVHLKHLIGDMEKIVTDTFPKNIRVKTRVDSQLWMVSGDPTQLHQILLNLVVNARDALPEGGEIEINADNMLIDDHYAGMNIEARVGPHVRIEVSDNGTGIPPEIIEKIYDPFFTTKEVGKGTGLGLSTAMAIAKSHGGFIRAYSEKGRGTLFRVYLPAVVEAKEDDGEEPNVELPRGRGETVLVVDDEASIRQITRQTLEAFGYKVILACDGAEAVAIYGSRQKEIDVVLTDMVMPVMDGVVTIKVLRRFNPNVRIIGASGISSNGKVAKASEAGVKHFLPKPYTAETLLNKLKQVLSNDDA